MIEPRHGQGGDGPDAAGCQPRDANFKPRLCAVREPRPRQLRSGGHDLGAGPARSAPTYEVQQRPHPMPEGAGTPRRLELERHLHDGIGLPAFALDALVAKPMVFAAVKHR